MGQPVCARISGPEFAVKLLVKWPDDDLKLLCSRICGDPEIITEDKPAGCVRKHAMNQLLVVRECF